MDARRAKMDAEAARYRLQSRLAMLAKVAKERGDAAASVEATRLRAAVDGVVVSDDEGATLAAAEGLKALEPEVSALQDKLGVQRYAAPMIPKWARFVMWTTPAFAAILGLVIWVTIRRRKRSLTDADMEALDTPDEQ